MGISANRLEPCPCSAGRLRAHVANGFLHFMQAAVVLYWTFNLFASFRTGYFDDGEVVTDSLKIAKRYLKGPFLIEFAIVAVDWIGFVIGMSATKSSPESTL